MEVVSNHNECQSFTSIPIVIYFYILPAKDFDTIYLWQFHGL